MNPAASVTFSGDGKKQASGVPRGWIKEFIEDEEDTQLSESDPSLKYLRNIRCRVTMPEIVHLFVSIRQAVLTSL